MRIRALWEQITIYDEDGNIIQEIPERPPEPPEDQVRMINLLEFEDRLRGIDPNAKPDYYVDLENDERFRDLEDDPRFQIDDSSLLLESVIAVLMCMIIFASIYVLM